MCAINRKPYLHRMTIVAVYAEWISLLKVNISFLANYKWDWDFLSLQNFQFISSSFQIQSKRKLLFSIVVIFSMKIACPKDTTSIIARCANLSKPSRVHPLSLRIPFWTQKKNIWQNAKLIHFEPKKNRCILKMCILMRYFFINFINILVLRFIMNDQIKDRPICTNMNLFDLRVPVYSREQLAHICPTN